MKMICPKTLTGTCTHDPHDDGVGKHCGEHEWTEACDYGADDCPACVPVKMICPKSETCKRKVTWRGSHCVEHDKRVHECDAGCLTLDCPACVEVKKKEKQ